MRTVLFVTWSGLPELAADDRLAADRLRARGVDVGSVAWDAAHGAWRSADALVLRSCWDYHLRGTEFLDWLDAVDEAGVPLWNPPHVVRWNAHKRYLIELAEAGLPVVPTALLERGSQEDLDALCAARGWSAVVIKPAIGASAFGARLFGVGDIAADADLARWRSGHDLLVQPFVPEIQSDGEWSLIFLGGAYSHAVRKRPRPGDFRVQYELGGTQQSARPSRAVIEGARAILDGAPGPWLYARVDGVVTEDGFLLMELEMLEPSLFLDVDATAPDRFADAVERLLEVRG